MQELDKKISIYRFIREAVRPFPWQMGGIIFLDCYWAIDLSLQPYVIKLILDTAESTPTMSALMWPVCFYILVAVMFTLTFRFYDYISLRFYPQLKANITAHVTDIVTKQSYGYFQNQFSGSLGNKIKEMNRGVEEVIRIFFDRFVSNGLSLVVACFTLMTVHPALSVILLIWSILLLASSFIFTGGVRVLSHTFSHVASQSVGYIVDIFSNIMSVRLFSSRKHEMQGLTKQLKETVHADKAVRWYLLKLNLVQGLSTALMIGLCLMVMVSSVESHDITVGDFGLVLTLLVAIANTIWNLADEVTRFYENYGLVSQGIGLTIAEQEIADAPNATDLVVTQGEIVFDNVSFHHKGHRHKSPLFTDKTVILHPGQKVGLVGFSGGGKTTFVHLIMRLHDIQLGAIRIDGQDIRDVTQDSLHRAIGMIPQDPTLFHRSILENIRYGRSDASDQEVVEAARRAHAEEFILRLPEAYDTIVGEKGGKLSGGQRQRIAIARAMLKNAPILILDEATSALDSMTESYIQESLLALMQHKTTLVIAHRLSTLLSMERILVFNHGKIVEDGTHHELMALGGIYKKLWSAQQDGFLPERKSEV